MMGRPNRTESDINAGAGSFKISEGMYATGVFKKYIGFN